MSEMERFCMTILMVVMFVGGIWFGSRVEFLEVANECMKTGSYSRSSVLYAVSGTVTIECKVKK